ncbi:MAG: transposase [Rhodobacteraceae bacterium]|nr:transposase [Paracoccaceae bacterium]
MVMPEGQRRRFRQLRHSSLKTARALAIKELGMSLWKDVCRGWARKAWKRWLGWAMRCRLEPMKEVARMVRKHQCGGPEGQQRSGRESQQPDQDDQGEGQGVSEQGTVHCRHPLPFGRFGLISRECQIMTLPTIIGEDPYTK